MELFNSYMRGGLSYLYEHFSKNAVSRLDYIEKIKDLVSDFNEELEMLGII